MLDPFGKDAQATKTVTFVGLRSSTLEKGQTFLTSPSSKSQFDQF
jgi:hypothetical protein